MAPRAVWKGYLKLSLVSCGIELTGATSQSEKVSFRIINRKTGNTVHRQYVDAVTGEALASEDEVKGYEIEDGQFLLFEEEEIDAVKIESSHTLAIENFVERAAIPPIYIDTPYYVMPSDKVSEEAFAVIREAMARKKMAGIARIVLYRRERPAMIEAFGEGLLLTTLRYEKTVRRPEEVFTGIGRPELDDELADLAEHIIDRKRATFDPASFDDRYEEALIALIEARRKGRKAPKQSEPARPARVVNLFDALKKSLAAERGEPRPAANSNPPPRRRAAARR